MSKRAMQTTEGGCSAKRSGTVRKKWRKIMNNQGLTSRPLSPLSRHFFFPAVGWTPAKVLSTPIHQGLERDGTRATGKRRGMQASKRIGDAKIAFVYLLDTFIVWYTVFIYHDSLYPLPSIPIEVLPIFRALDIYFQFHLFFNCDSDSVVFLSRERCHLSGDFPRFFTLSPGIRLLALEIGKWPTAVFAGHSL